MKCEVCNNEILDNHTALYNAENGKAVCIGCENKEIEVWRVSLPGEKGGYIDSNFESMVEEFRELDVGSSLEIHKEMMLATKYITLPEFTDF
jgi:hypothetical protein